MTQRTQGTISRRSDNFGLMSRLFHAALMLTLAAAGAWSAEVKVPQILGAWWTIAGDPDLRELTSPKQQPVDFAVWQAADGMWQLWSCIRNTRETGKTRLFHRWESTSLTNRDWTPRGVAMRADPVFGETSGGLQAPFVLQVRGGFQMFYGDWEHVCVATSVDGRDFQRRLDADGRAGMFTEGIGNNTRDPMVLILDGIWHCYYTAYPARLGAVYGRTSTDGRQWSASRVVAFGGQAGTNAYSAECPFVVELAPREFYLFRTQRYGKDARTSVYHSADPMDFGIDRDSEHFVTVLPGAAPEIIRHDGRYYIAALLPSLKGIQMARLEWVPRVAAPPR